MDHLEQTLPAKDYNEVIGALNPSQKAAAISNEPVIRTVAGPGTGKTKTMEARVRHLIEQGVDPKTILALSFTNESASEFKGKVEEACGLKGHQAKVGTFHATFNHQLRVNSGHEFILNTLGYENFFIIDTDDQTKIFTEATKQFLPQEIALMDALNLKRKNVFSELSKIRAKGINSKLHKKRILNRYPNALVDMEAFYKEILSLDPSEVSGYAQNRIHQHPEFRDLFLCKIWNNYTATCKKNNAMDFDDVLCNFFYLIKYNPSVARKIALQLTHVLVDEYQDSNYIQVLILRELKLANPSLNLFIVGDPRQSIYGFRASDVSLMVNAEKFFGPTTTYEIDTNYRSSNELLKLTNLFAGKMAGQITSGQLDTGAYHPNIMGHPIEVSAHRNDKDEALYTLNQIQDYLDKGVSPEDIYILYRTRTGVKPFEELLKSKGIEYDMIGEMNFWEHAEVKDIAAFIRVLARPKDILAWARVAFATKVGVSDIWLRDAYHKNNGEIPPVDLLLSRKNAKNKIKIDTLVETIKLFQRALNHEEILTAFIDERFPEVTLNQMKHYIDTNGEYRNDFESWRYSYIGETVDIVKEFWVDAVSPEWNKIETARQKKIDSDDSIEDRVSEKMTQREERILTVLVKVAERLINGDSVVDIADDLMTRVSVKQEDDKKCLKLMTGHACKGLESKVVFMLANENETWYPMNCSDINHEASLSPSLDVNCDIAEAQRLFYVMMTRASNNLHMSYAENRVVNGMSAKKAPLTMMTQLIEAYKQHDNDWQSIIKFEKYPMASYQQNSTSNNTTRPQLARPHQQVQESNEVLNDGMKLMGFT